MPYYNTYSGLNQNFIHCKKRINLEASTRCPLLCPGCVRTRDVLEIDGHFRTWEIGDMDIEVFKLLVRPENGLTSITYNMALGDPIYSGTLFEQLKHLNSLSRRPIIHVSTNGSGKGITWWEEFASLLGPMDVIEFAVDGLEDTNHIYRVNSKWDTIITGIKTLRKHWQGRINWRYIVFEHNYHQVKQANQLAKSLNMSKFHILIGDARTPAHMLLKSKTWEELLDDIS